MIFKIEPCRGSIFLRGTYIFIYFTPSVVPLAYTPYGGGTPSVVPHEHTIIYNLIIGTHVNIRSYII